MPPAVATARANVNIALVKYWGKRDPALNLPATGSISLTLDGLGVEARVAFGETAADELEIDGRQPRARPSSSPVPDVVRAEAGRRDAARVRTAGTVPRGAGLASSAAAFAALALAGSRAAGLRLEPPALSALARRGSGSAARSIFGGFVEWHRGERPDGRDSIAEPLAPSDWWDVRVVAAIASTAPKAVSSRAGMTARAGLALLSRVGRGRQSRPGRGARRHPPRDLEALGLLAELSALRCTPWGSRRAAAALLARRDDRVHPPRVALRAEHGRLV
jgi:diphosphomevalonate decarboxylase